MLPVLLTHGPYTEHAARGLFDRVCLSNPVNGTEQALENWLLGKKKISSIFHTQAAQL